LVLLQVAVTHWCRVRAEATYVHAVAQQSDYWCLFRRFEEAVAALGQEPVTTEEMDALEKHLNKTQQVGGPSPYHKAGSPQGLAHMSPAKSPPNGQKL
jgi:hypothetical protein